MCNVTITPDAPPSNANAANHVVAKAAPGVLFGASVFNAAANVVYLQLFDATDIPGVDAPSLIDFAVPAHSSLQVSFGTAGRSFATGIVLAGSNTAGEYEAVLGLKIDAQFA